jgi:hypothetical protein
MLDALYAWMQTDDFFNWSKYTGLEAILFAGGCWMWVIVYGFLIHDIRKYKTFEMPTFVAAGNFAWEANFSWFFPSDMGHLAQGAYQAWFFLDLYIWWNLLKLGSVDCQTPWLKQRYKPYVVVLTIIMFGAMYTFCASGLETPIGAYTAYTLNCAISIQYVVNYMRLGRSGQVLYSVNVAWLKLIGTAMNTGFMAIHFKGNTYLLFIGAVIFLFDLAYAVVMTRDRIKGLAPSPKQFGTAHGISQARA